MYDRTAFYGQRIAKLEEEHSTLSKQQQEISRIRLILFLLIVGSIVWTTQSGAWILLATLVLTIFFIIQVRRHTRVALEASIVANTLQLNRDELAFMKGDKSLFPQGDIQLAADHIYAIDLDIFGKGSLFQSIDRTGTWEGKGLIIDALLGPPKDISEIQLRKDAITELAKEVEWRQRFHVVGKMADESAADMPSLRQWASQPDFFAGRASWI